MLGAVGGPATSPTPGPWPVDEGAGTCDLTVSAAVTVEPLFEPLPVFPLSVSVKGVGWVTSAPEGLDCQGGLLIPRDSAGTCAGRFAELTLTAKAGDGYRFRRWVGCAANAYPVCTTTLRRSTVIQAEFVPVPRHEVRVTVTGPGAVQGLVAGQSCTPSPRACRAMVMEGGEVVLTAVPEKGHFLVGWTEACAGRELTCRVPVGGAVGVGVVFQ